MDIADLLIYLDIETGRELSDPDLLSLMQAAVPMFNRLAPTQVTLTGTTLSRVPSASEQRLLVLCGIANHLRAEGIKAAKRAVIHTNVAGRTDLTKVPNALLELAKSTGEEMVRLIEELGGRTVEVYADELGETLNYTFPVGPMYIPWWAWGR